MEYASDLYVEDTSLSESVGSPMLRARLVDRNIGSAFDPGNVNDRLSRRIEDLGSAREFEPLTEGNNLLLGGQSRVVLKFVL